MDVKTVGSVCSGIEAASVAWKELDFSFKWLSETGTFQSKLLEEKYPGIKNLGDMKKIPESIFSGIIETPDLICGGTPCQAFSLAGHQNGIKDERGNLTLKFVDIVNENDRQRSKKNAEPSIVLWENVEGVLTDKTNAFGCFLAGLSGADKEFGQKKWSSSGLIRGEKRNVAWRGFGRKIFRSSPATKKIVCSCRRKKFQSRKRSF